MGLLDGLIAATGSVQSELKGYYDREDKQAEQESAFQRSLRLLGEQQRMRTEEAIATDERNWKNEQERSPVKTKLEIERKKATSAADLATTVEQQPARLGLLNAEKTNALGFEVDNADTINALAKNKADAVRDPNSARLHEIQFKSAELAYTRALEESKVPTSVLKAYDAAKSQYHDLLIISSKADFDPNSDTGKRIVAQQAETSKRMGDLLTPYLPKDAAAPTPNKDTNALRAILNGSAPAATTGQPAPKAATPEDSGYLPDNPTQFKHVLDNINNPAMLKQAKYWIESGGLTLGQKQQVLAKIGSR